MNQSMLGRAALISLALGASTVACTPSAEMARVGAPGAQAPRRDAGTARLVRRAHDALGRGKADRAVSLAESAVARQPGDADNRVLLGEAYLAAGRFASAGTMLSDALALAPDQPHARLDLGLAQLANGDAAAARATLQAIRGEVPAADLGLALALAGDRAGGIALLTDLVRQGKSDARARQNLALALALDGQWAQARGLAMQDVRPDQLDARLDRWATLARDGSGRAQVAAMLGVIAATSDPGQPAELALAAPTATAPVRVALAAPVEPAPAAPVTAPVRSVSLALAEPAVVVRTPVLLASASVPAPVPAWSPPARVAAVPVTPGPVLHPLQDAGFVVQLGAFARADALQSAWAQASRLAPNVATLTPVRGSTELGGAVLVRLSVGGFPSREAASGMCRQIKARGGACFVRAATGDRRLEWAGAGALAERA